MNHIKLTVDQAPAGICIEDAFHGDQVRVLQQAALTSSDGKMFYSAMDMALPPGRVAKISKDHPSPYAWSSFLARFGPNGALDIWYNFPVKACAIALKAFKKGDPIVADELAGFKSIDFGELSDELAGGLVFGGRSHWQAAVFYDLVGIPDTFDAKPLFHQMAAGALSRLVYDERSTAFGPFKAELLKQGWFPFARIPLKVWHSFRAEKSRHDGIATAEQMVYELVTPELIDRTIRSWEGVPGFTERMTFFREAADCFRTEHHIPCISTIAFLVEGVLRTFASAAGTGTSQDELSKVIESLAIRHGGVWPSLLPQDFGEYLKSFHFQDLGDDESDAPFSRNSIAHGVAKDAEFGLRRSCQLLLMLDQLALFWRAFCSTEDES